MIPAFKLDFWLHSSLKESVSKWKAVEEGLPCARTECVIVACTVHVSVLISDAKQSCSQPSTGDEKLILIKFIPDTWESQKSDFNYRKFIKLRGVSYL